MRGRLLAAALVCGCGLVGCGSGETQLKAAQPSQVPSVTAQPSPTPQPQPSPTLEAVANTDNVDVHLIGEFEYRFVPVTGAFREYSQLMVAGADGTERQAFVEFDLELGYVPFGPFSEILAIDNNDILIRTTFDTSVEAMVAHINPDGMVVDQRRLGDLHGAAGDSCRHLPIDDPFCLAQVAETIDQYTGVDASTVDDEALYAPAAGWPSASWTWHRLLAPGQDRCDTSTLVAKGDSGFAHVVQAHSNKDIEPVGVVESLAAAESTYIGPGDTDNTFVVIHTSCRPNSAQSELRIAVLGRGTVDGVPTITTGTRWVSAPFGMASDLPVALASITGVRRAGTGAADIGIPCRLALQIEGVDDLGKPVTIYGYPTNITGSLWDWQMSTEQPSQPKVCD